MAEAEAEEASLELEPSMSNLDLSTTNLDIDLNDSEVEEVEEIEEIKEEQEDKVCDETVSYTDPMGNTFEAPVIDVVNLNKETMMSVVVVDTKDTEDDFAFDFSDEDDGDEAFF